jgi:hypothetical protein
MTAAVADLDTAGSVLAFARGRRAVADAAEADLLQAAVAWAAMHPADSIHGAATLVDAGGETGIAIAGAGAPLVAEFAVVDLAAALGVSTDAGRRYLGQAVELRYRLPRVWKRVVAGDLVAWKARRIAEATLLLDEQAAEFVDTHVAPAAHKIGPIQLDRVVQQAIATFMPDEAEERRRARADRRHVTIDHQATAYDGTSLVHGELDLADALDLDAALGALAAHLKDLGCPESLDVRRSMALGELARTHPTLDLGADEPGSAVEGAARPSRHRLPRPRRGVVLHVHLSHAALTGAAGTAWVEEGGHQLITSGQVRDWCHAAGAITVRPVLDPDAHDSVDSPVVPARHRAAVAVRDTTCVFPWCTRPARRCDADHVVPHDRGGPTCPCNLAPLCRRHHRVKTHGGWSYTPIEPGVFLWTGRHGLQFLRDRHGTLDVSRDRARSGVETGSERLPQAPTSSARVPRRPRPDE